MCGRYTYRLTWERIVILPAHVARGAARAAEAGLQRGAYRCHADHSAGNGVNR
jgi:hypothetical protein